MVEHKQFNNTPKAVLLLLPADLQPTNPASPQRNSMPGTIMYARLLLCLVWCCIAAVGCLLLLLLWVVPKAYTRGACGHESTARIGHTVPLSLPGRWVPISSSTTFSSVQFSTWHYFLSSIIIFKVQFFRTIEERK